MIQFAAWLALCLGAAVLSSRRPATGPALALVLWGLVPSVAGHRLTGLESGPLSAHPGTLLLLVCLLVQLMLRPVEVARLLAARWATWLALTVFVLGVVATALLTGRAAVSLALDTILGPVAAVFLLLLGHRIQPDSVLLLRNTIIGVATVNAILALIQFLLKSQIFFVSDYQAYPWFGPNWSRWMGLTDHPLVLAFLLTGAAPLLLGLRSSLLALALGATFVAALAVAQTRVGLVLLAATLVVLALGRYVDITTRARNVVLLAVAGLGIVASGALEGVVSRFVDDQGSAAARGSAIGYFLQTWGDYLVVGGGARTSYDVSRQAGLLSSFENTALMYAIDYGTVLAVCYFGVQALLILRALWVRNQVPGALLAAVLLFVQQLMSSTVATASLCATLLWAVIGLSVCGGVRPPPAVPRRLPEPDHVHATESRAP